MYRKTLAIAVVCSVVSATKLSAQDCQFSGLDILEGFEPKDISQLIDLPDPDTVRATLPLELPLVNSMIAGELRSFSKTWCQVGIQDMIVDISIPVEDDAIFAIEQRAHYVWDSSGDPIGWRIEAFGERFRCARSDEPYAALCP